MNRKGSAHLTKESRRTIRDSLAEGLKLKEIAALVGKDETTVSKEIMKRARPKANGVGNLGYQNEGGVCIVPIVVLKD